MRGLTAKETKHTGYREHGGLSHGDTGCWEHLDWGFRFTIVRAVGAQRASFCMAFGLAIGRCLLFLGGLRMMWGFLCNGRVLRRRFELGEEIGPRGRGMDFYALRERLSCESL